MSAEISLQLTRSDFSKIQESNQTELVNRFFEIASVQKIVPKFVTESALLILQIIFGLILVTFYHPSLLLFNLFIIFCVYIIWSCFYKKSTLTAFDESRRKYDMAGWLEEIARNSDNFKSQTAQKYARLKVDFLTNQYLKERKNHFRYLFKQVIALFLLYAIANSALLIFGGFLVINEKLSLGQLVASELILSAILYRISRFGKDFEAFYDLNAACEKLSQFYNIPTIKNQGLDLEDSNLDIEFKNVQTKFLKQNHQFNLKFEHNKSYLISTDNSSTQEILINLIKSYEKCDSGEVLINKTNINKINPEILHGRISTINNSPFIEDNLREYLTLNLKQCDRNLEQLLEDLGVLSFMKRNKLDLDSRIIASGWPFLDNERIIIKVAKAILEDPKIIIINEIFDTVKYKDITFDKYCYINADSISEFKNIDGLIDCETNHEQ